MLTILTERETSLFNIPTTTRAIPAKSIRKYQKPILSPTTESYGDLEETTENIIE